MQVVIIGSSAAGVAAAAEARKVNTEVEITIISEESHIFYHRPSLTEYIGDNSVELKSHFYPNKAEWYLQNNIELILNEKVTRIEPLKKEISTLNGRTIAYDKLIIAAGAKPFIPIKDALKFKNVFAVRGLDDAKAVYEFSNSCKSVAIIGGGLLGLEAASALLKRNISVDVIELSSRILPAQLDSEGAELFASIMQNKGIRLHTGCEVNELIGEDSVKMLRLKDGKTIQTDMVIFAIGARANLEIVAGTEINCAKGIVVNERMETNLPDIYACGDIAQFGKSANLWMPALKQGKVAGLNALGAVEVFKDEDYPVMLNSFGIRLFSAGDVCQKRDLENYLTVQRIDYPGEKYQKLYFKDNQLCGAVLIGDVKKGMELTKSINAKLPIADAVKLF